MPFSKLPQRQIRCNCLPFLWTCILLWLCAGTSAVGEPLQVHQTQNLKKTASQTQSEQQWVTDIEPGIRRVGHPQPTASLGSFDSPEVSPSGNYFVLVGPQSWYRFDTQSLRLQNRVPLPRMKSSKIRISSNGQWIAVGGVVEDSIDHPMEHWQDDDDNSPQTLAEKLSALQPREHVRVIVFDKEGQEHARRDWSRRESSDSPNHFANLSDLHFSVDGKRLIITTESQLACWEWEEDRVLEPQASSDAPVRSGIELDSNEALLVGPEGIQIWNRPLNTITAINSRFPWRNARMLLGTSPDQDWLVLHDSQYHLVRRQDLKTCQLERLAELEISRFCFSPDGSTFAAFVRKKAKKLRADEPRGGFVRWSLPDGKRVAEQWFKDPKLWFKFCWLPEDRLFVSQHDCIHALVNLQQPLEPQLQMAFRNLGSIRALQFGDRDQQVLLDSGNLVQVDSGNTQKVSSSNLLLAPQKNTLLQAQRTRNHGIQLQTVRPDDPQSQETLFTHQVFDRTTMSLIMEALGEDRPEAFWGFDLVKARFSPDQKELYCLFQEYKRGMRLVTWSMPSMEILRRTPLAAFPERRWSGNVWPDMDIAANGSTVAVTDHDQVVVFDSITGQQKSRISTGPTAQICLSRDGQNLAVTLGQPFLPGKRLTIYRCADGSPVRVARLPADAVSIAFSSASDRFLIAPTAEDQAVQLWDTTDWSLVLTHHARLASNQEERPYRMAGSPTRRCAAAISSDGKSVAIGLSDSRLELWNVAEITRSLGTDKAK